MGTNVTKPLLTDETGQMIVQALTQSQMTQTRIAEIEAAAASARASIAEKTEAQLARIPEVTELSHGAAELRNDYSDLINTVGAAEGLFDISAFNKTDLMTEAGVTNEFLNGWVTTDYIPCRNRMIEYTAKSFTGGSERYRIAYLSFYDADKTLVSYLKSSDLAEQSKIVKGEIAAPENAYFVRAVGYSDSSDYCVILKGHGVAEDLRNLKNNMVTGINLYCIGDSLTRGVIGGDASISGASQAVIRESYPYWIKKTLNANVKNCGYPGATAKSWWNDKRPKYPEPTSATDVVTIMLGTNSGLWQNTLSTDVEPYTNYEDYADTHCGCYCKIIEWAKEKTANHAQIVLIAPPKADTSAGKNQMLKETRDVIYAIANRYSLPVIDCFLECGISEFDGAKFRSNDGLHFNAEGYHKLGTFIAHKLASIYSTFDIGETGNQMLWDWNNYDTDV